MAENTRLHARIAETLSASPLIGVVRTPSPEEAAVQAERLAAAGVSLIEITFTVPDAPALVSHLLAGRQAGGPPFFGMGTVTTAARAREAVAAGAEFVVTPNVSAAVVEVVRPAGLFLVMGALTPTEVVAAHELGADLIKVYPLPPVGGAAYLATIRQPLGDLPMLAAGGFGIEEIPAYARAGAVAFGMGGPLLLSEDAEDAEDSRRRVARALSFALKESAGASGPRKEIA
jgi:2-dehydro-3-deoxyphosphogluconate aldolase/(4S)-4-hydroxy-2-oxoglutarate aldolase